MPLGLKPIQPKKDPFAKIASGSLVAASVALGELGREAQRRLSSYPTSQTAYRRTGTLGRNWTMKGPRPRGSDIVVTVGNKVKYARKVQGPPPAQTERFKDLGWQNVKDVADEVIPEFRPIIERSLRGDT